jgi:glycosyltransferase involved in cell wall biosynthesis
MVTVLDGTQRVLRRLEPDVCYRRSLDFEIFPLTGYAKLTDARFIYGVAHDDELTASPRKFDGGLKTTRPYRWLNRQALAAADAVITQNPTQTELAKQLGRTIVAEIPNCYSAESADPIDWSYDSPVVFWAARFAEWKQPEIVLELAQSLPEVTFVMAGGGGDGDLFERFSQRAAGVDNLAVLGHIPFEKIDRYFAAADLFLNTSEEEGFPNTFLQAWANEIPVVSLQVDPDDVLTDEDIGVVADGSVSTLREQIKTLAENPEQVAKLGQRSREYLERAHSVETITDKYERVFKVE